MWTDEQLGLRQGEDLESVLARELQAEALDKQRMLRSLELEAARSDIDMPDHFPAPSPAAVKVGA
jgi:hypothetical protein